MVDSCLTGYNGTVFAYGQVLLEMFLRSFSCCLILLARLQTGSGKTFTMQGVLENGQFVQEQRGLMPRTFEYLFQKIVVLRSAVR